MKKLIGLFPRWNPVSLQGLMEDPSHNWVYKKRKTWGHFTKYGHRKSIWLVGWEVLHKVMEKFSFHKKFIQSIKTLFYISYAQNQGVGGLSMTIHLQHGCHQGCPASPELFNLSGHLLKP